MDINAQALKLATINAEVASIQAEVLQSGFIPDGAEVVIANPPYMMDPAARAYRNGGPLWGGAVALDWATSALERMAVGGVMLLYTGAAFVNGEAPLLHELETACSEAGASFLAEEIDPDIFSDELKHPNYARAERLAAIGVVIKRPD